MNALRNLLPRAGVPPIRETQQMEYPVDEDGSHPRQTEPVLSQAQHAGGVTLIEAMVALFILSLTLGGGIYALTTYQRLNEAARRQLVAVHTARSTLEMLSPLDFLHPLLNDGTHTLSAGGSYSVTRIPSSDPLSPRKRVDVSVPWTDPVTGNSVNIVLTTVISEALHQ